MRNAVQIAIVYHSGWGHTAKQAEAVRRGVEKVAGASTLFLTSEDAQSRWDELAQSDAIVFGAPTYMGGASGQFKTFMDATSKLFFEGAWKDKVAAGFTNSASRSGDKLATLIQFAILAAQHGMHWVSLGLPPANNHSKGSEQELNRLGFFLGAGAQSNADEGPDVSPPQSDLLTAEHLGERVATVAAQFARGRVPVSCLHPDHLECRTHH
jgi:multimeric flavodoxin WrbA